MVLQSLAYAIVHSFKTGGYLPYVLFSAYRHPKNTILGTAIYYLLRFKSETWCRLVHNFASYGSSSEVQIVHKHDAPYDASKKYLMTGHPHGLLCDGLFNLIARKEPKFYDRSELTGGFKVALCVSKFVRYYPIWGEMVRDRLDDVDPKTLRRLLREGDVCPAMLPGGFSEAVYLNADPEVEYCFIEGRKGFLKIAIEEGVDIIPMYTFGLNDMYSTVSFKRHERAVLAQKLGIPLFLWWGKLGTNIPFTDKLSLVYFDVFRTTEYTIDQLDQCHADYKEHLRRCFDSYKQDAGYGHKRIEFIGKDHRPMLRSKL